MLVSTIVGPVPADLAALPVPELQRVVRRARPGETARVVSCPVCSGRGTVWRRHGGCGTPETCRRCAGDGQVEGVVLLRLESTVQTDLVNFVAWARENRLGIDRQLLVREEGNAEPNGGGWSLVWSGIDGGPLRLRRGNLAGRFLLGVAVESNGVMTGHIATHFTDDDGGVVVFGIWDFSVFKCDAIRASWCSKESRAAARRWSIAFPEAAVRSAIARSRCPGCRHMHFARDTERAATTPAVAAAIVRPNEPCLAASC